MTNEEKLHLLDDMFEKVMELYTQTGWEDLPEFKDRHAMMRSAINREMNVLLREQVK